ncbi:MAG: Shikimate kinase 1 [bacterium ADurb.Bin429]|nr:MAG: Shikimate kinase 1 [bacterium ADurb.Bin429]
MKNIVLIGMPGAGKSTVGVLLAKSLKRPFLDTDLLIQTATDRYLQEIIDSDGMEAFLDLEAHVIGALQVEGTVIATGGSVVYRETAMRHLASSGTLIYLAASCATIEQRLNDIATRGIARQPGQDICSLYAERHPLYRRYATFTISTDAFAIEEVVTHLSAHFRK